MSFLRCSPFALTTRAKINAGGKEIPADVSFDPASGGLKLATESSAVVGFSVGPAKISMTQFQLSATHVNDGKSPEHNVYRVSGQATLTIDGKSYTGTLTMVNDD